MIEKGYEESPENINEYLSGQIEQELALEFNVIVSNKTANGLQFNFYGGIDMSDFNGAKPIMTVRDSETKVQIVDGKSGDTATLKMSVVAHNTAFSATNNDMGIPCIARDTANSDNLVILPVPLPITDNGGAITVDGEVSISGDVNVTATDLDIRNLTFATDSVDVSGSTVTFDNSTIEVTQGTSPWVISGDVNISDNGGSITVDFDRLDYSTDNVEIKDAGGDALAINTDGSINVNVTNLPVNASKVFDYQTTATVGVGLEVIHFYTVTNAKTFIGKNILVGARGAVEVRFGLSSNGTSITAVKGVYFQDPKENRDHAIDMLELLGDATAAIAIGVKNLDGATSDVYTSLQGYEI